MIYVCTGYTMTFRAKRLNLKMHINLQYTAIAILLQNGAVFKWQPQQFKQKQFRISKICVADHFKILNKIVNGKVDFYEEQEIYIEIPSILCLLFLKYSV
jgi:hypothetical protein